jgi:hypothetical protein
MLFDARIVRAPSPRPRLTPPIGLFAAGGYSLLGLPKAGQCSSLFRSGPPPRPRLGCSPRSRKTAHAVTVYRRHGAGRAVRSRTPRRLATTAARDRRASSNPTRPAMFLKPEPRLRARRLDAWPDAITCGYRAPGCGRSGPALLTGYQAIERPSPCSIADPPKTPAPPPGFSLRRAYPSATARRAPTVRAAS